MVFLLFQGCLDKLTDYVKNNLMILGAIGVGLACIQVSRTGKK